MKTLLAHNARRAHTLSNSWPPPSRQGQAAGEDEVERQTFPETGFLPCTTVFAGWGKFHQSENTHTTPRAPHRDLKSSPSGLSAGESGEKRHLTDSTCPLASSASSDTCHMICPPGRAFCPAGIVFSE